MAGAGPEFVHLHVHSQYSMLDGAVKVKDLVKRVAKEGMKAVAVTDHGNMFGAISFYKAAKDAGVQAILGCEIEVADRGRARHLPLLASTLEGYKNLVRLVSLGHVQPDPNGPAGTPTVSLEALAAHTKGLVAMTGCMGGLPAQAVLEEGEEAGKKMLGRLKEMFEPGALYVELQDHGLPEQPVLNDILLKHARSLELPIVATNDVHFPEKDDAQAHLYLSCIKTNRTYAEALERHHGSGEMYLKSPIEMAELFSSHPEALRATLEIAERCSHLKLTLGQPMLPNFKVPEGYDTEGYFRHVARQGLEKRFEEIGNVDRDAYRARLEMELDVIAKMKFPGYFLIVWDFIRHAKEIGVPVGPGRGSGAGSIVAYAMRITDLDPIPLDLLFERFLNPERVSMPDFDVDFCMDKRDRVIAYVQEKYGVESVGQIATFAELKAKSVVKDVARTIGILPNEAQAIANLIPRKSPAETYTIQESLAIEPKLKARYESEPQVRECLTQASKLEGLTRQVGKHAAGIVISEGPLWDHVPVFKDESSYVTQYYKEDVEAAGLVKFDFLGLKTLTVLDIATQIISDRLRRESADGERNGERFDLAKIPLDDKATYALLASGETKGVFQLESSGMQQLFKDLRADVFEDIVAAVALYRPGPLGSGMVKDFVDRKHGRAKVESLHALVDSILVPTYGVIVYQEQVMQIARALAGYTLGGADLLRRAMGKKKPEEMAKQKGIFLEGAKKNGVSDADAERIFGLLEYFAGYGFNKSHSAAYALITYQTAYLKAHYPAELLCAILTSDKDRIDKVVRTIADARAMGITVLPPDINESDTDFKVVYAEGIEKTKKRVLPQIRFGLGAVRGVGLGALEAVFEARKSGPFIDLFDFASRVEAAKINKGVLQALVQCGAFDTSFARLGITRAQAYASVDVALERSRAASRDRERGQTNLFGLFDAAKPEGEKTWNAPSAGDYLECAPWDRKEMLARERQSLGFYVSGHPLERYLRGPAALARLEALQASSCNEQEAWSVVKLAGMVEGYRERIFRDSGGSAGKIAFFELEDLSGRVNVKVRGNQIDTYAHVLTSGEPVLVTGKVSYPRRDDDDPEPETEAPREATVLLNDAVLLSDVVAAGARQLLLRLRAEQLRPGTLEQVSRVMQESAGSCPVALQLTLETGAEALLALGPSHRVEIGDALLAGLEKIFGAQVAELR
jgi:DNA polymerase-3 subunit alpha